MRAILVAFICLLASPVAATNDAWPALYDVTGVASDDVLNIRESPNGNAHIIGSLPPDAMDVELVRPDESKTWALVNTGERSGWVSLAFLKRQPGYSFEPDWAIKQCFGTEPFWSLAIGENGEFSIQVPNVAQTLISEVVLATRSGSKLDRNLFRGRVVHPLLGDAGGISTISAIVRNEACTDGMSDRSYGYSTDLIWDTEDGPALILAGCCSLSP